MILVTGSSGHLGEALLRTLLEKNADVRGMDINPGEFTDFVGSISDQRDVKKAMDGVTSVFHTWTLHKPHVVTHSKQHFVDTNITGTLNLLEAAVNESVKSFIFTSTTSVFGDAMRPAPDGPAVWVTEELAPKPKNIYGITKLAAEELCRLFSKQFDLNILTLRTSRFFPEEDDDPSKRALYSHQNIKALEFLYRRVEISDVVDAHLQASLKAPNLEYGSYIISATSPFTKKDLLILREDPKAVIETLYPESKRQFADLNWRFLEDIDRVYINELARRDLDWSPKFCFSNVMSTIEGGSLRLSDLAAQIGAKAYHKESFSDGPYPVD